MLRDQWRPRGALVDVVDGVREEQIPVPAQQIGVLQLGHHHEGFVRVPKRSLEQPVELLQLGGVTRPVDRTRDVDTRRAQHLEIRKPCIDAAGRHEFPAEIGVIVAAHHLITRQRPVYVPVREGERALERFRRIAERRVEVPCHVLLGPGGCAVKGPIREVPVHDLLFALPDSEAERRLVILSVPVVSDVYLHLSGPEKRVGRRKSGDRTSVGLGDHDAIRCSEHHMIRVGRAAKRIGVPLIGDISPGDAASLEIEPREPEIILVCDRGPIRGGDGLDPNEIGPFVHRQHQLSGEGAELHSRERYLEAGAVSRDHATLCGIDRVSTTDLGGGAREAWLFRHAGRGRRIAAAHLGSQVERGVPEHVPFVPIDDVLGELNAQIPKRSQLLVTDPS